MLRFFRNKKGQVFSEYGLMIVIVVIMAALLGWFFRDQIKEMFANVNKCSSTVMTGAESGCTGADANRTNYGSSGQGGTFRANTGAQANPAPAQVPAQVVNGNQSEEEQCEVNGGTWHNSGSCIQ